VVQDGGPGDERGWLILFVVREAFMEKGIEHSEEQRERMSELRK